MAVHLRLARPAGTLARFPLAIHTLYSSSQPSIGLNAAKGSLLLRRDFSGTLARKDKGSSAPGGSNGDKPSREGIAAVGDDAQRKLAEDAERKRIEAQDAALKEILDNAAAEKRKIEEEALQFAEEKARQAAKETIETRNLGNLQQQTPTTPAQAFESSVGIPPSQRDAISSTGSRTSFSSKDQETADRLLKESAPLDESSSATSGYASRAGSGVGEDPLEQFRSRLLPYKRSLESSTEYIRSALPENLRQLSESVRRKDYRDTVAQLAEHLNNFTGYSSINELKHKVTTYGDSLDEARIKLIQAKQAYEDAISTRSNTQKAINDLLQRKHLWSPDDVNRFTDLYRSEHANEHTEQKTKSDYKQAESDVEEKSRMLTRVIMERYHEEQVWSDKIRAASTYGTWGLVTVNVMAFLIVQAFVEPRRRRKQVERYEELVQDLTERGVLPEKNQVNVTSPSNGSVASTVTTPPADLTQDSTTGTTPIAIGGALLGGDDILAKLGQSVERQEERLDRVENMLLKRTPGVEASSGELVVDEDGSLVYLPAKDDSMAPIQGDNIVHDEAVQEGERPVIGRQSRLYFVYQDGDMKAPAVRRDTVLSGLGGAVIGGLIAVAVMMNM
ncbi:Mdm33 family-domain-containing protein [Mortierella sp. GBAus27b]|nr:sensitivity to high expression protein she9 [Mortierella sp. GBA43]KAI8352780.1 Mdm33 family-domain-containing protein [Mortierella sp. GBAus27b]